MATTTKKTPLIIAAVVVIAVIVGIIIVVNGGNKSGDSGSGGSGGETTQNAGLQASDLATVDETVAYGDYNAMKDLSSRIQNGEMTGKVVKVEGLVNHPVSTYSIVQRNAENTASIGTVFKVEGWSDSNYPADKAQVEITGKVVEDEPMVFIIKTLPEFVVEK